MSRPIDKEFEEADDTGVLDISGRKLRQFPVVPGEILDFSYVFEAGGWVWFVSKASIATAYMWTCLAVCGEVHGNLLCVYIVSG